MTKELLTFTTKLVVTLITKLDGIFHAVTVKVGLNASGSKDRGSAARGTGARPRADVDHASMTTRKMDLLGIFTLPQDMNDTRTDNQTLQLAPTQRTI